MGFIRWRIRIRTMISQPQIRHAVRIAAAIVACAYLTSCTEIFDEFSTWPELPPPTPVSSEEEATAPGKGPRDSAAVAAVPLEQPASAEIHQGTGKFVKPPRPRAVTSDDGDITLNFADANIREVVRVVLGDILGLNYVIDPAVQGTITIQTSRPLSEEDLLPTLESLLALTGAALVSEGPDFKVAPLANAPRETRDFGLGTQRLPRGRGYGVQVVPLEYVSAVEMQKVLAPVASDSNILSVDSRRNLLILGGSHAELDNLLELIYMFDVDWLEGMSFGYFPLAHAEVKTLVDELRQIVVQGEDKAAAGLLRFVPIERLNALIAISPRPGQIERVRTWIERLDRSGDQDTSRLFVYRNFLV